MKIEYMVSLKDNNGKEYTKTGNVEVSSELGYFGDKSLNKKVIDAIRQKHPDCEIVEFNQV